MKIFKEEEVMINGKKMLKVIIDENNIVFKEIAAKEKPEEGTEETIIPEPGKETKTEKPEEIPNAPVQPYVCKKCGEGFPELKTFRQHILSAHKK